MVKRLLFLCVSTKYKHITKIRKSIVHACPILHSSFFNTASRKGLRCFCESNINETLVIPVEEMGYQTVTNASVSIPKIYIKNLLMNNPCQW